MDTTRLLLLVTCVLLAVAVFAWWWERTRLGRRSRARIVVAQRGEGDAIALLEGKGFHVLDRQVTIRWTLYVDGAPVEVTSRADLLVGDGDGTYVAEVKTGGVAPDPTHPATRRQLLEYQHAFAVDGVLLVDMAEGVVREVAFDSS